MPLTVKKPRALCLSAAAAVAAWTVEADPAWASALGVDVWNVYRLNAERREADARGKWWDEYRAGLAVRFELNAQAVDAVIAGRPLAAVAARMWADNQTTPGYRHAVELHGRGPTPEAKAADNLIVRVTVRLGATPPAERAAVLARLRAEYRQAYGVPAGD